MVEFQASLQGWQVFYATLATASAALSGLLFVALSLRMQKLNGLHRETALFKARSTFSDFLTMIVIALVFLVPHQVPYSLSVALFVLAGVRGAVLLRQIVNFFHFRRKKKKAVLLVRDLFLPFIVCIGLLEVAIGVEMGSYLDLYNLVAVITALLLAACWHAWGLLVEE